MKIIDNERKEEEEAWDLKRRQFDRQEEVTKRTRDKLLHPTSIMMTLKIFSMFVVGATFPKPTEVKDEKVKYKAVT